MPSKDLDSLSSPFHHGRRHLFAICFVEAMPLSAFGRRHNPPARAGVFISHSHRDLEKVRRIRNELERRGHHPLRLFLKCLEADNARLPELTRDEIKGREWFVLCDSQLDCSHLDALRS